jgi:hypothetical protein
MSGFHVGQKVVCVDAAGASELVKGNVYIIDGFVEWGGKIGLNIVGICIPGGWYLGFRAARFRPVKSIDISIFTSMLVPSPRVKERADS